MEQEKLTENGDCLWTQAYDFAPLTNGSGRQFRTEDHEEAVSSSDRHSNRRHQAARSRGTDRRRGAMETKGEDVLAFSNLDAAENRPMATRKDVYKDAGVDAAEAD